jgi:hypothetical protein
MVIQVLHCPYCQSTDIVCHGTTRQGKQRYRCRTCPDHGRTFLLAYAYAGQSPEIKRQIVDMALNAVAYLGAADNVSRPLPSPLSDVNQPVIRSRNPFSGPHPARLASL